MAAKIRKEIDALNKKLTTDGSPYTLLEIDPAEISLLAKNARYMEKETFSRLVTNIEKDASLFSVPLCYRRETGKLVVLSGNHRVQAAVAAGITSIIVMVINKKLTKDEQLSIQLSHNALVGKDDQQILKELWAEIEDLERMEYAGLDTLKMEKLTSPEIPSLVMEDLSFEQLTIVFLPEEHRQLRDLLEKIDDVFESDDNYIASRRYYDQTFALMKKIKTTCNIVSTPVAFHKMIELAAAALEKLPKT